jgi:hypothetical protein
MGSFKHTVGGEVVGAGFMRCNVDAAFDALTATLFKETMKYSG